MQCKARGNEEDDGIWSQRANSQEEGRRRRRGAWCSENLPATEPGKAQVLAAIGGVCVGTVENVVAVEEQLGSEGGARRDEVAQTLLRDSHQAREVKVLQPRQAGAAGQRPERREGDRGGCKGLDADQMK